MSLTNVKTPWNPSKKAIARVKDRLPIPTACPHCQSQVVLANNSRVYGGKSFGDWPWVFLCSNGQCGAHVGLHPYTDIPLGTLATEPMRQARNRAKQAFNPIWQDGSMTRSEAYAWLASQLCIPVGQCHIGWFDVDLCERVVDVCNLHRHGVVIVDPEPVLGDFFTEEQMKRLEAGLDSFEFSLSTRQEEWLENVVDRWKQYGAQANMNERTAGFVRTVLDGFYSVPV